ncbi:hypothetical protein WR25_13239 [Diploscapter pachys]|uniref:Uncharacterized protein n=1 Tax=Diploscapter pachys TaxID=2018661 RepID=A0A2A2M5J2_9BILA|nr:hypothetical protein WR25_13239 [Diploscapter pachys]
MFDMRDRGELADAMAEVEDVRPVTEGGERPVDARVQGRTTGEQRQRVEIALHRQPLRQHRVCPGRIHCLVEPDRVDASLTGIGGELAPCPLGKADDDRVRTPRPQPGNDRRIGRDHPAFELIR